MSKLAKIFATCAVSLPLAGCVTTQNSMGGDCMGGTSLVGLFFYKSYNEACATNMAANTMLASPRKDMQLVGATAIRNQSKAIDQAFNDVQNGKGTAPVKEAQTCTVKNIKQDVKGKKGNTSLTCSGI